MRRAQRRARVRPAMRQRHLEDRRGLNGVPQRASRSGSSRRSTFSEEQVSGEEHAETQPEALRWVAAATVVSRPRMTNCCLPHSVTSHPASTAMGASTAQPISARS